MAKIIGLVFDEPVQEPEVVPVITPEIVPQTPEEDNSQVPEEDDAKPKKGRKKKEA